MNADRQARHVADEATQWAGLRSGMRIWLGGNNTDARREIETSLPKTKRPTTGSLDAVFITPNTSEEAAYFAAKLKSRLTPDATVWVIFPDTNHPLSDSASADASELVSRIVGQGFLLGGKTLLHSGCCAYGFLNDPAQ